MSKTKKRLDDLTDAEIDVVAERRYREAVADVEKAIGRPIDMTDPRIKRGLEAIAKLSNTTVCAEVEVGTSPEAVLKARGERYCDGIGCALIHAVEHDLAASELLEEEPNPDTVALREFCMLVYDTLLYDELSVLIPWPTVYAVDARDDLHFATGPAVAWADGYEYFFWHGQPIDKAVIMTPDEVTAEYLLGLSAEKRRASYEALGHDRAIRILGLKVTDESVIGGLQYQLYRGSAESWLRMQSPPLQDGSQPFYVEPVHESCQTCASALGWRATGNVGATVTYEVET